MSDISEAILEAVKLKPTINTTYNIGSNDNLSLLEVAQLLASKYGVSVDFVSWPEAALKIESGDTIFDGGKLEEATKSKK